MSGAKRYTAEESDSGAWRVMDEDAPCGMEVCLCTGDVDPGTDEMRRDPRADAERIARLLNAEEEVRAALRATVAAFGDRSDPEVDALCEDVYGDSDTDIHPRSNEDRARVIAKVRAALSALDAEAVRP